MNQAQDPSPTLMAALAASAQGRVEEALHWCQEACTEQPDQAAPHFLRAAHLVQLGRIREAESAYATAIMLAPEVPIIQFELGALQFTSGQAPLALLTWMPLLMLPDGHALKLFVQGYAQLAQDQFESALELFRQGMVANTENAPLNVNIELIISAIEGAVAGATTEMSRIEAATPLPTGGAAQSAGALAGVVPAPQRAAADAPSESQVQFLLSAYQRDQGSLH